MGRVLVGTPLYPGPVRTRSAFRGLPLGGTAAAGVLLGHWLAYVVAFPAPAVREQALQQSGHAYWLNAVRLAVVLAVSGLAVVVGRFLRGPSSGRAETFASLSRRLAAVQVVAFTGMEVAERLVAGAPLAHMLQNDVFLLGLAAQVVVACLGALLLLWFGRGAASVAGALRPLTPPSTRTASPRPRSAALRPLPVLAGATGVRGPPPR
jgi:hypothetical protein